MTADPKYYVANSGYVWEERFAAPMETGICIAEDLKQEDATAMAELLNYAYLKGYNDGAKAEFSAELQKKAEEKAVEDKKKSGSK